MTHVEMCSACPREFSLPSLSLPLMFSYAQSPLGDIYRISSRQLIGMRKTGESVESLQVKEKASVGVDQQSLSRDSTNLC